MHSFFNDAFICSISSFLDFSLANFDGASYLQYNAHDSYAIRTEKEYITFRFRTNEPDGILLHGFGTAGDYLLFQLLNSKLVVTLNLGEFVTIGWVKLLLSVSVKWSLHHCEHFLEWYRA